MRSRSAAPRRAWLCSRCASPSSRASRSTRPHAPGCAACMGRTGLVVHSGADAAPREIIALARASGAPARSGPHPRRAQWAQGLRQGLRAPAAPASPSARPLHHLDHRREHGHRARARAAARRERAPACAHRARGLARPPARGWLQRRPALHAARPRRHARGRAALGGAHGGGALGRHRRAREQRRRELSGRGGAPQRSGAPRANERQLLRPHGADPARATAHARAALRARDQRVVGGRDDRHAHHVDLQRLQVRARGGVGVALVRDAPVRHPRVLGAARLHQFGRLHQGAGVCPGPDRAGRPGRPLPRALRQHGRADPRPDDAHVPHALRRGRDHRRGHRAAQPVFALLRRFLPSGLYHRLLYAGLPRIWEWGLRDGKRSSFPRPSRRSEQSHD